MLNDALAALIGVGSSRTGTAVSLYVRTQTARGIIAKLIKVALIYRQFASARSLDLVRRGTCLRSRITEPHLASIDRNIAGPVSHPDTS